MTEALILVAAYVALDELQQHAEQNGFKPSLDSQSWYNTKALPWLNKKTSWKNKHQWQPSWLFKTALVSLTDGEHFFQLLKHLVLAALVGVLTGSLLIAVLTQVVIAAASFILNEVFLKR